MKLFERLAVLLGRKPEPRELTEFKKAYHETYKRWRYQPDNPVFDRNGKRYLLIADRGGMFIGDEHDFCATLAYILSANYGEANFPDGKKHPVVMYKGWVCQPGIAPSCADNLAKTAKITVTFPIRNAAACKALGYELLIQGK